MSNQAWCLIGGLSTLNEIYTVDEIYRREYPPFYKVAAFVSLAAWVLVVVWVAMKPSAEASQAVRNSHRKWLGVLVGGYLIVGFTGELTHRGLLDAIGFVLVVALIELAVAYVLGVVLRWVLEFRRASMAARRKEESPVYTPEVVGPRDRIKK